MFAENEAKATRRASLPIHGYVGPNGAGKDLAMVHDALPDMRLRLPILTTIPLRDFTLPCLLCGTNDAGRTCECGQRRWPLYAYQEPFDSLHKLVGFKDGLILVSEVQGIASAREHTALPFECAIYLRKIRHYNSRFAWNAPDWEAPDVVIRRVTQAVTTCEGLRGEPHPLPCTDCGDAHIGKTKTCTSRGRRRLWNDNRAFKWRTFDRADFDRFNTLDTTDKAQKKRRLKPIVRQRYNRPGNIVETVYDTYGEVLDLAGIQHGGVCPQCGGTRRRRTCEGHSPTDDGSDAPISLRDWQAWDAAEVDGGAPEGGDVDSARSGRHRAA